MSQDGDLPVASGSSSVSARNRPIRVIVEELATTETPLQEHTGDAPVVRHEYLLDRPPPRDKDAWDKAQVVGSICLGLATVFISGLAAMYAHQAGAKVDEFNRRQVELRTAELAQKAFESLHPTDKEAFELTPILLADLGRDSMPLIKLMLKASMPRVQELGVQVAVQLQSSSPKLGSDLINDLIDYAVHGDPSLRTGAVMALNEIDLRASVGPVAEMLEGVYACQSCERDENFARQGCLLAGKLPPERASTVLLQALRKPSSPDVRMQCLNSLESIAKDDKNPDRIKAIQKAIAHLDTSDWDNASLTRINSIIKELVTRSGAP